MIRLLVVRHGYTVTNAQGRYTGQMDAPLTEEGKDQAKRLAAYLATHEKIDKIYASDLSRAIETAAPTAAHFDLPIIPMQELREIDVGDFTGVPFSELDLMYRAHPRLKTDVTYPYPGGESFYDLYLRTDRALRRILAENEGKTVMIVTHAGGVRCISCMAAGDPYTMARNHPAIANTAMDVYHYENEALTPVAHEVKEHLDQQ